jgi:predicted O-methyltransferase YrrM
MQLWRFLTPRTIGFSFRMASQVFVDRVKGAAPLPLRVRDYITENARRGDPDDVLRAMDEFATKKRFLMNIGPAKGPLVREVFSKLPSDARVLELGAFCGYSSILFASTLGPDGRIVSIEKSEAAALASRANIEFAGLSNRIEILHGGSTETRISTRQISKHSNETS